MIDSLHLYPKEKERMQEMERQGYTVMTCNNWLCPFNNDGYCVSREHGDECSIYGDEDFDNYLNIVYDESLTDEIRESHRKVMIQKWGRIERKEE
jgi:hypothetical protein